jgi:hypothetical protein
MFLTRGRKLDRSPSWDAFTNGGLSPLLISDDYAVTDHNQEQQNRRFFLFLFVFGNTDAVMTVHVASRKYTNPWPLALTMPLGIDTDNFNMDWLEGSTTSNPMWDPSPINSLAVDDYYGNYTNLNDFPDLKPPAYVVQADSDGDSTHSLVHSSVCVPILFSFTAGKGEIKIFVFKKEEKKRYQDLLDCQQSGRR